MKSTFGLTAPGISDPSTFRPAEELALASPRLGGKGGGPHRDCREGKSLPSALRLTFISRQGLWGSPVALATGADRMPPAKPLAGSGQIYC